MDAEADLRIRKAEPREQFQKINLLPTIPHESGNLDVAVFGPNSYEKNRDSMSIRYFHSKEFPNISFKPATTSESISVAAYGFGSKWEFDAKRDILDPRWMQLGCFVMTREGVFTNTGETDERVLKKMLNGAQKINGIYLLPNEVAFAPYETFERGVQDCDTFSQGGLARALEHTPEKVAGKLRQIASPKFYKRRVDVWDFGEVKRPILRVSALDSDWGGGGLNVDSVDHGYNGDGFAFGVLENSAEGTALKK